MKIGIRESTDSCEVHLFIGPNQLTHNLVTSKKFSCGQSYKASTIVIYDSYLTWKYLILRL